MTWIQTYSGIAFDLLNPSADDVEMEDIGYSLAALCRYNGHTGFHYSVAQHSTLIAQALERDGHPPKVVLGGLLHDAVEAYLGDMTTPMKQAFPAMAEAMAAATLPIESVICQAVGINPEYLHHPAVKAYDTAILVDESEMLLGPKPRDWGLILPRLNVGIMVETREQSARFWLDELHRLKGLAS